MRPEKALEGTLANGDERDVAAVRLTGCDHEHSEQISIAAAWLAQHWTLPEAQPFTRALRQRFGLGFRDAVRALAEARRIREGVASSR